MKTFHGCLFGLLLWCSFLPTLAAPEQVLPGLSYYKGPETLEGKLIFLVTEDGADRRLPLAAPPLTEESSATLCELDLAQLRLKTLTTCPNGNLYASASGNTFSVVWSPYNPFLNRPTNTIAFVYTRQPGLQRTVNLDGHALATIAADSHVFFYLEAERASGLRREIVDYDIDADRARAIALPDASRWEQEEYGRPHFPHGVDDSLHFLYSARGGRLGGGTDYPTGYYAFDIHTQRIRWCGESTEDRDDPHLHHKAADGRYIFFEGGGHPNQGGALVSSELDFRSLRFRSDAEVHTRRLRTFSRSATGKAKRYLLQGLSPCRQYAWVRYTEMKSLRSGWLNIYYLVDVSSGATRILLRDEVERKSRGSMSVVQWVRRTE